MSTPTETPNPESTEVTEEKPDEGTTPETTPEETTEEKPEGELPEWAQKERTSLRAEAANWRTKFREAESALKDAKTPEEFEAARSEMSAKIAELEHKVTVSEVARKHDLPDELAARLRGKTKEELEADAKALLKYVTPQAPERLSGGLTPDDGEDSFDPYAVAQAAKRDRY